MAPQRPQPLDERITSLRAEINAFIDNHVAQVAKECPGVPAGAIRNSIMRGVGCPCSTYLEINAKERAV